MSKENPETIPEFRAAKLKEAATKCLHLRSLVTEGRVQLEAARAARDINMSAGNQAHVMSCEDDLRQATRALSDADKLYESLKALTGTSVDADDDDVLNGVQSSVDDAPTRIRDGASVGRYRVHDAPSAIPD